MVSYTLYFPARITGVLTETFIILMSLLLITIWATGRREGLNYNLKHWPHIHRSSTLATDHPTENFLSSNRPLDLDLLLCSGLQVSASGIFPCLNFLNFLSFYADKNWAEKSQDVELIKVLSKINLFFLTTVKQSDGKYQN